MRIYQRNKISCFLLTFILIQALLMFFNVAWGGGRIDNIRLEREGDYTRITIYGDKPFEFSHSIEEAKKGKPHRLVIDCRDMVFDLPQHEFREGLPSSFIRAIRTSQYQVTPERIVRVVLDLNGTVEYKVLKTGSENRATIAILTTKEPGFTPWMAVKETKEDNRVGLAQQTIETETGAETEKLKMPAEKAYLKPMSYADTSDVLLGPYLEEKTSTDETKKTAESELVKTGTGTGTGTEMGDEQTVAMDLENTMKRGIGAVLGTEGVVAHESDTLAPGVMTIQNPLQADLGIVSSRKLISYHPETRRDPFVPLTEREDMQFGEAPLPRFENLKLVGIIRDTGGNQALLEDEIGFGYILKSGDRIKNGYVLSVEENKVVFQVEEYGGYKTMMLELNPEY